MGVTLHQVRSLDDLSLGTSSHTPFSQSPSPSPSRGRRARSSSPVKNRHSFHSNSSSNAINPGILDMRLASLPLASLVDIFSKGNSSQDQLRLLSRSPIGKRLHITSPDSPDTKYVIPVPFTLKLPPKLSPVNIAKEEMANSRSLSPVRPISPVRSRSPSKSPKHNRTKLVYNGSRYEKIDTLSDDDDYGYSTQEELQKRIAIHRRPVPPPVVSNKNKSMKMLQNNNLASDQLSIIEETSNYSGSRLSSVKSNAKSLPPLPKDDAVQVISTTSPIPVQKPAYTNVRIMPTPQTKVNKEKELPAPHQNSTIDARSVPRTTTEENINLLNLSNAPIACKESLLKIGKRTFSDESQVSSVSSFSSVGDVMSFHRQPSRVRNNNDRTNNAVFMPRDHKQLAIPNSCQNQTDRNASSSSSSSSMSENSESSWDSLQRSVDLSLGAGSDSEPIATSGKATTPIVPYPQDDDDWEDASSSEGSTDSSESSDVSELSAEDSLISESYESTEVIQPLKISRNPPISPHETVNEIKDTLPEIHIQQNRQVPKDLETGAYDSENDGAGSNFSFPNTSENITNDSRIRQLARSSNSLKSTRSRFSYMSNNGQIEIPDLSDKSVTDYYSTGRSTTSYNGTTFDDVKSDSSMSTDVDDATQLGPMEFPSKEAKAVMKQQFKLMHNDIDSDTDIESTKYSLYSQPRISKTLPSIAVTSSIDSAPISKIEMAARNRSRMSPVRHSRHKSMYNIDFNNTEVVALPIAIAPPSPDKSHNRSKSMDILDSVFKMVSTPRSLKGSKPSPRGTPNVESETMNIAVAEPPIQVNYAVDFKEAASADVAQEFVPTAPTMKDIAEKKSKLLSAIHRKDVARVKGSGSGPILATQNTTARKDDVQSSSSKSSYKSNKSDKPKSASSESDTESVVIDLTEGDYDVCMVKRNNSTMSYKSIIEKTKDGKDVEVVLVEEDVEDEERDELLSIYSKYRNNHFLFRSNSTMSSTSSTASSSASFNSTPSETQLKVHSLLAKSKTISLAERRTVAQELKLKRSSTSTAPSAAISPMRSTERYNSRRIQNPSTPRAGVDNALKVQLSREHSEASNSRYFDYAGDNYDFKSFMQQRQTPN